LHFGVCKSCTVRSILIPVLPIGDWGPSPGAGEAGGLTAGSAAGASTVGAAGGSQTGAAGGLVAGFAGGSPPGVGAPGATAAWELQVPANAIAVGREKVAD
jgi:hypothetical protein